MMDNKWKIMDNKKKKNFHNCYKRYNWKTHHHICFKGLLGVISPHKGIHPQIIFLSLLKVNPIVLRKLLKWKLAKSGASGRIQDKKVKRTLSAS